MAEKLRSVRLSRDAVVVTGPEAVAYLQGQVSQDVAGLDVGASAWSWILQPAGKVDALVRVTRTGPDTLLVDVDEGSGGQVLNRLTRFKLRTKATLSAIEVSVVMVRGDGAEAAAVEAAELAGAERSVPAEAEASWPEGALLAARAVPLWRIPEEAADVIIVGRRIYTRPPHEMAPNEWEPERIAAGVPVMGAELTEKTIPAETGLVDQTASFTKGCYTGQELVARIDSRGGNVPRHLRGLRSASPLTVGTELVAGGKVVGTVTSAAVSPKLGPIGLGYVGRAVSPGAFVGAGVAEVEVVELPIRG